jgi:hypothetical protein
MKWPSLGSNPHEKPALPPREGITVDGVKAFQRVFDASDWAAWECAEGVRYWREWCRLNGVPVNCS